MSIYNIIDKYYPFNSIRTHEEILILIMGYFETSLNFSKLSLSFLFNFLTKEKYMIIIYKVNQKRLPVNYDNNLKKEISF